MSLQRTFKLTNSLTGKKEDFKTKQKGRVTFYSCGPTVYGPIHIGNARALIFADQLYRWLLHIGYEVNFVRNYTDVDDKIIDRAKTEGKTAIEVADEYVRYCEKDIELMGLKQPTKVVRVTETIPEIISLIETIIARGHAYVVEGEVLYSVESFPTYGKLSGKKTEDLLSGARVEVDRKKKNPLDFSLWKPVKPGEPFWDSPWGKGRPGWHIECSAMAMQWLGETIDLHHGGPDLIFPHHENEIAQTEAATGKPFCNHWVHHAFLTMAKEKMSKSLGNLITCREFLEKFDGELLKFIYTAHHYRSMVEFSDVMLKSTIDDLERIYKIINWAQDSSQKSATEDDDRTKKAWEPLLGRSIQALTKVEDELFQDLNGPGALGHIFTLIREINRAEADAAGKPGLTAPATKLRAQVAGEVLSFFKEKLNTILNVFNEDPSLYLQKLEEFRRKISGVVDSTLAPTDIQNLIDERANAKKAKNFSRADEIRKELDQKGILLVDSPQGTTWKHK